MHLDLPHLIFPGAPLDDATILNRLPAGLADALRARNGCVAYRGGLHVRGACLSPGWHSLRRAWEGADAFHALYAEVSEADVPFAEDAFGDQFLLRGDEVVRLSGELGEVTPVAGSLEAFSRALLEDAGRVLDYEPLLTYLATGSILAPGQLLAAYPPFVLQAEGAVRKIRAEDALERRRMLAELARRLHGLPEGTPVQFGNMEG